MLAGSSPSSDSVLTICSGLLFSTADFGKKAVREQPFTLFCYQGNTPSSAPRAAQQGLVGAIHILIYFYFNLTQTKLKL
jgi:hypothetical protein